MVDGIEPRYITRDLADGLRSELPGSEPRRVPQSTGYRTRSASDLTRISASLCAMGLTVISLDAGSPPPACSRGHATPVP